MSYIAAQSFSTPYGAFIEGTTYQLRGIPKDILKAWCEAKPRPLLISSKKEKLPDPPSSKGVLDDNNS